MNRAGMNGSQVAGTHRLTHRGTFAVLALLSQAGVALAQGSSGAGPARATPAARAGTTRVVGTSEILVLRAGNPLIDSLSRRLNSLPVGSAEYFTTDSSLKAAIAALPRLTTFGANAVAGGVYSVQGAPSRVALRMTALDVI